MNAKDVMRVVVEGADMLVRAYIDDLDDGDLLVRAVPGSNHIAWQLGHMIGGTAEMLEDLGHKSPPLPDGFRRAYTKETASCDDPARFASKDQYRALLEAAKTAILEAIEATPDEKLDAPGPEPMRAYAPTLGAALTVLGTHWLMHAAQFVPIRRKLGKTPMF